MPDILVSDNGSLFKAGNFRNFASDWDFCHVTSNWHYSRSNGKAESAVKTAKRLFRKAKEANSDVYLALLDHRNTPRQGSQTSPTQCLMARRMMTLLPTMTELLRAAMIHLQFIQQNIQKGVRQRHYYNRGAKDLIPF